MSRSKLFALLLVLAFLTLCHVPVTATERVSHIRPEREVLIEAEDVGFDYMGNLRRAERGEIAAVVPLINFSTQTDAAGALAHGWVLLDLQTMIGKKAFSTGLAQATDGGRKTALDIMEVARTYK